MATCIVSGTIYDGFDSPLSSVKIVAFPSDAPVYDSSTGRLIGATQKVTVTSSTGYFELVLTRYLDFCINIKEIGFKEVIRVPDAATMVLWGATTVQESDLTPQGPASW